MARRVHVRAVVEGIGIVRRLDALIAARAAHRVNDAAVQNRRRFGELVRLRVVDEVARDNDRARMERVQRTDGGGEHLSGQRFLRPERRCERQAEPVEQLEPSR